MPPLDASPWIRRPGFDAAQLPREGRWTKGQAIRRVWMSRAELQRQTGELSRSYNNKETGADSAVGLDLCDHLEYADRDGDLNILW